MLAFIRNRISQGDAEDVLQDVFVSFLLASDTGDPINRVSSWLYQTTKNKIIDNNRKHTEERMSQIAVQQGGEIYFEDITETLTDETTPENDYLRSLLEEELEAALSELPEKQRYVFEQTEFLGRTFKELSEELDDPVATLISRKHYAVKYLRNRLKLYIRADEKLNEIQTRTMTRRLFIYSSDFIRVICKTNAELSRLR